MRKLQSSYRSGEFDHYYRSVPIDVVFCTDRSSVRISNAVTNREPKTRASALCCEEWVKNLVQMLRIDSSTVVADH